MKFRYKCAACNQEAAGKAHGLFLCAAHKKLLNQAFRNGKHPRYVFGEKYVANWGGLQIYKTTVIKIPC